MNIRPLRRIQRQDIRFLARTNGARTRSMTTKAVDVGCLGYTLLPGNTFQAVMVGEKIGLVNRRGLINRNDKFIRVGKIASRLPD